MVRDLRLVFDVEVRPAVGRVTQSGRQRTLRLTSTHGESGYAQRLLTQANLFVSGSNNSAEQLIQGGWWERIWDRILSP